MTLRVDVQLATDAPGLPEQSQLVDWARCAWLGGRGDAEVAMRVVGEAEGRRLNHEFRGKDQATNVLSFPFEPLPGVDLDHLGDLVICAAVVAREASAQGKPPVAHWAHMVVHGMLHLQGYEHETDEQAAEMEGLETRILSALGFAAPYAAEFSPDEAQRNGE